MAARTMGRAGSSASMSRQLHGGNARTLDELRASMQRMEHMLSNRAGITIARRPSQGRALSYGSVDSGASPAATRPSFVGAADHHGHAIVPRNAFLRSLVTPPASTHVHEKSRSRLGSVSDAEHEPPETQPARRDRVAPKSTMLRKLEEEMRECTFQPNAERRRMSKSAEPPLMNGAFAPAADHPRAVSATPQTSSGPTGGGAKIFDRLYQTNIHHVSHRAAHVDPSTAGTSPTATGAPGALPAARKPGTRHRPRELQRCPYGPPSRPIMDKDLAAPQPQKAKAAAKMKSTDRVPRIFERLYKQANQQAEEQRRTAAERSVQKKQVISQRQALQQVERLRDLERQRDAELEELRRQRQAIEQRSIEEQRRRLSEHINNRRPIGRAAPLAANSGHAPSLGPRPVAAPKPRDGGNGHSHAAVSNGHHAVGTIAPVHHSKTSTGVESAIMLTPNGTWRREAHATSTEAMEDTTPEQHDGSAYAAPPQRPAGVAPLQLGTMQQRNR